LSKSRISNSLSSGSGLPPTYGQLASTRSGTGPAADREDAQCGYRDYIDFIRHRAFHTHRIIVAPNVSHRQFWRTAYGKRDRKLFARWIRKNRLRRTGTHNAPYTTVRRRSGPYARVDSDLPTGRGQPYAGLHTTK